MSVIINYENLSDKEKIKIRKDLSFSPKSRPEYGSNSLNNVNFFIDLRNNRLRVPFYYGNWLKSTYKNLIIEENNNYESFEFDCKVTPRGDQPSVIEEALNHLDKHKTTLLNLPTGYGKTFLMCYLISKLKLLSLICLPLTNLCVSTAEELDLFGLKYYVMPESNKKVNIPDDVQVIVSMDGRVKRIPESFLNKVGVLLFDELHLFCTKGKVKPILSTQPKYVIGCTATIEKSNGLEKMMKPLIGHHFVYRKIDKEYTVEKLDTGINCETYKKMLRGELVTDYQKIISEVLYNENRYVKCIDKMLSFPDSKWIILCLYKKQLNIVCKFFDDRNLGYETFSGSDKYFKDSRFLIGTVAKMGTGVDYKNACYEYEGKEPTHMMAMFTVRDKSALKQYIGRLRVKNPYIIHLVDQQPILRSQFYSNAKYYAENDAKFINYTPRGAGGSKSNTKSGNKKIDYTKPTVLGTNIKNKNIINMIKKSGI